MTADAQPPVTPSSPGPEGLLANARRVLALAEGVRDAQRVARQSDNFSERKQHVQDLRERLALLAAAQQVMSGAGIAFAPSPKGAGTYTATAELFESVRSEFGEDPESLFGDTFRKAKERALAIAGGPNGGLEKRLRQGWAAHVESVVQTPGSDQLDVFAKIPAFQKVTAELRQLYEERTRLSQSLPMSDDEAQAPHRLAAQIEDAWARLGGDAPETVLELLRAAGTPTGAALDTLTNEVREWLDDHGVTDALRIRIS
jgi:hypothetical protein